MGGFDPLPVMYAPYEGRNLPNKLEVGGQAIPHLILILIHIRLIFLKLNIFQLNLIMTKLICWNHPRPYRAYEGPNSAIQDDWIWGLIGSWREVTTQFRVFLG